MNCRFARTCSIFLILLALILSGIFANAQTSAQAELSALSIEKFPTIEASLTLYDSSGNFASGLRSDTSTVLEDGHPRLIDSIEEIQLGVQIVVALDPSASFETSVINPSGITISRYSMIYQTLSDWVVTLPNDSIDDLSLVITNGPSAFHLKDAAAFMETLSAYQPNVGNLTPSLQTLSRAIDIASEPMQQPEMKRAVLFITSPSEVDELPILENLTGRAAELKVRIYVWIVSSQDYLLTTGVTVLRNLSSQTGGQYFFFSGDETLPNPEKYFSPLRHIYHLSYTSGISASGSHTMTIQTSVDDQIVATQPVSFSIDIQLPNPILVSPPEQIVRQIQDPNSTDLADLMPAEHQINAIIEFPDGYTRPITLTTLFVDNQPVDTNTSEPFTQFSWDISAYLTSGEHFLQIEAVDSLGLSKTSLAVPISITIIRPKLGLQAFLARNSLWVASGAVALTGIILASILVWSRIHVSSKLSESKTSYDPVTHPIVPGSRKEHLQKPRKQPPQSAPAYLLRLKTDDQPMTSPPIPLVGAEITFGSDPIKATRVFDDPTISARHARLRQTTDGEFLINDEKSVAGTWVNLEQVNQEPRRLHHGDVIQIGQLSYQFILHNPPEKLKPRILPAE